MKQERLMVLTVTVCLIAVFSSFMWVYSKTLQRTADDLVKIKGAEAMRCDQQGKDYTGFYCAERK